MTLSRSHRKALGIALAGALALGVAACAGGTGGGGGSAGADNSAAGPVTWWSWTPDTSVGEAYIAAFNEEYPDIEVEYTNYENADFSPALQTAFQTGSGPDVFAVAPGGVTGRATLGPYALDLAPAAEEALGADWKDLFATGYVDAMTYDDKVVGLPLGGVAAGLFWINKDLFDANGVPTELATYDDLKAACDTFAAAGVTCFTMGTNSTDGFPAELLRTIINSYDPDYFLQALQGTASWDDPTMVAGLDMMRQMQADGIIAQDATSIKQYPEANNTFISQKAAIVQMGTWYAQYAAQDSMLASMEAAGVSNPTPFTMLPMISPDFAGDDNVSGLFGETDYGIAINASTKNLDNAETFALWLTTTTVGQQKVANAIDLVPALKGVTAAWDDLGLVSPDIQEPAFQALFQEASAPVESRNTYQSVETNNALVVAVQRALSEPGTSTADIAAQTELDAVDVPAE